MRQHAFVLVSVMIFCILFTQDACAEEKDFKVDFMTVYAGFLERGSPYIAGEDILIKLFIGVSQQPVSSKNKLRLALNFSLFDENSKIVSEKNSILSMWSIIQGKAIVLNERFTINEQVTQGKYRLQVKAISLTTNQTAVSESEISVANAGTFGIKNLSLGVNSQKTPEFNMTHDLLVISGQIVGAQLDEKRKANTILELNFLSHDNKAIGDPIVIHFDWSFENIDDKVTFDISEAIVLQKRGVYGLRISAIDNISNKRKEYLFPLAVFSYHDMQNFEKFFQSEIP